MMPIPEAVSIATTKVVPNESRRRMVGIEMTFDARWWMLVVRGLAVMTLGVLAIATPPVTPFALVVIWGAYAFGDGLLALIFAMQAGRESPRFRGWLLEAIGGMAAAVLTWTWPLLTALAVLALVATWAMATAAAELGVAVALRHVLGRRDWLLVVCGVGSLAYGVCLAVLPAAGRTAIVWVIGAYALLIGALLVARGLGVRKAHRRGADLG